MNTQAHLVGTPVFFLCLTLAIYPTLTQAQSAQETTFAEPRTLDRVLVTGSRIKRTDVEAQLPITTIQKQDMEALGISSAEELMMVLNISGNGADNLASNVGIVNGVDQRGNNGVSSANLRGQGADATLVLFNGRRIATHGLKGRVVDLNSIPFAAIERVEVLRDGASAVYGTDAIGGVINFITRTDFQGMLVSAFTNTTEEGGGNIHRGTVLAGMGDLDENRWNLFATLSWKKNEILRGTKRRFSNGFQPERGLSPDSRGTPFATIAFRNPATQPPSLIGNGLIDPEDGTLQQYINLLDLPGGAGCETGHRLMGPYDDVMWGQANSRYACSYDYAAAAVMQQPLESKDAVLRATFKLADQHRLNLEFVGADVDATKQFEPYQIAPNTTFDVSTWYPATGDAYDAIYNGLAAYFGPDDLNYGEPIAYRWRCVACGGRTISTSTRSWRVLAAIEGELGSWSYDIGLSRAASKSASRLGPGYYYTNRIREVLGSGLLNPFLLPGQSQSQAAMDALAAASAAGVELYGGRSAMTTIDASFTGGLWLHLPGGEIQLATGVDLRREEYGFGGNLDAEAERIYLAPFDNPNILRNVSRDAKAAFVELYLPILHNLNVTAAARYDHYQGFGSTTNPKYSFKWRPLDSLAFRGAYSTGFKIPTFNQLYNGVSEIPYTGLDWADPATCPGGRADPLTPGCEAIQPVRITGGKADLQPETAQQKSVGVVFDPASWFNISFDWWEIKRKDSIRAGISVDTLLDNYASFSDNFIRDDNGQITAIDQRYLNSGGSIMRGIEIDSRIRIPDVFSGRMNLHLNGSYLDTFRTQDLEILPYTGNLVGDYVRYFSLPLRWKHTFSVSWQRGHWSHTLTQVYRHGYRDEVPVSVRNGSYVPPNWNPDVPSFITYNYSLRYTLADKLRLTFGINNLFDRDPPFTAHMNDFAAGAGWEPRIASPRGRAYTLLAEYRLR